MNIGIYTYYNAVNEGAFLQAYCLKSFFENNYGATVSFLPIKNQVYHQKLFSPLKTKNPFRRMNFKKRKKALDTAREKTFVTAQNEIFDMVVFGSDELWNINNPVFSDENMGASIKNGNMISYAVSMGNTSPHDNRWKDLKAYFDKFRKISVRDYNSAGIIRDVIGKECQIHVDPVFLHDIPVVKPSVSYPYLLVYGGFYDDNVIKNIKRFAAEKKLKIIAADLYNRWCKTVVAKSPWEFMGYIENADYVVTNMFHGTMLSILKKKKFVTVLTEERKNKLTYALERFGCTERAVGMGESSFFEKLTAAAEIMPDGEYIDKVISEERVKTGQYFDK
ncbi:MAG: polysaccharide pyruvyl transferase family protein [Ruminococcus sp.]|nr:polysaccharide pyruvyl transferase family protein [Ruminococcus sp.]